MTSNNNSHDQLHWDSIMDVLHGRARTLTEAKHARMGFEKRRATLLSLGYHTTFASAFAVDPQFVDLALADYNGVKWGDIMYYEQDRVSHRISDLNTLIANKTTKGRWRLDNERRTLAQEHGLKHLLPN
jgi:hypothetical protein